MDQAGNCSAIMESGNSRKRTNEDLDELCQANLRQLVVRLKDGQRHRSRLASLVEEIGLLNAGHVDLARAARASIAHCISVDKEIHSLIAVAHRMWANMRSARGQSVDDIRQISGDSSSPVAKTQHEDHDSDAYFSASEENGLEEDGTITLAEEIAKDGSQEVVETDEAASLTMYLNSQCGSSNVAMASSSSSSLVSEPNPLTLLAEENCALREAINGSQHDIARLREEVSAAHLACLAVADQSSSNIASAKLHNSFWADNCSFEAKERALSAKIARMTSVNSQLAKQVRIAEEMADQRGENLKMALQVAAAERRVAEVKTRASQLAKLATHYGQEINILQQRVKAAEEGVDIKMKELARKKTDQHVGPKTRPRKSIWLNDIDIDK